MSLLMRKRLIVVSIFFFFTTTQLFGQGERLLKIPENTIDELRILQQRYGVKLRYRTTDFSLIQADESAIPELRNAQILDTIVPDSDYYILFLNTPDALLRIEKYGMVLDPIRSVLSCSVCRWRMRVYCCRFRYIIVQSCPRRFAWTNSTCYYVRRVAQRQRNNRQSLNGLLKQVDVNRWFAEIKTLVDNEDLARPGVFFRSRYSLRVREAKQFDGKPKPDYACDNSADYIAQQFRNYGLEVEFDPFLHSRLEVGGNLLGEYVMRNVVATLPGKGPNRDRMYLMTASLR